MEDVNKRRRTPFFLSKLECGPKKSTPGKFAYICHFQQIGKKTRQSLKKREFILKVMFSLLAVVDANPVSMVIFTSCAELEQVNRPRF